MTLRVPMVSLERARELGDAMGMPARRTQSEAFRVVANNPGVARVAFGQLMQLLENNKFDTRLRELMIMRIGWVTGSAYEWTQHWRVATTAGIPPEDILAVRDWRNSARLTAADKAILAATDECLAGKSISDAAWAEVAKHVTDPGQQVEFIIAMGNWMSFSMLFRNLRIPLAEGVSVWPPDGLASPAADSIRSANTKETSMSEESSLPLLDHELAEDELAWMQAVYADFGAIRASFSGREREFNPKEALREVLGRDEHRLAIQVDLSGPGPCLELEPFAEKWTSFGWAVREVDGHDHEALLTALAAVPFVAGKPSCLIANTVKGKGVSFMENTVLWHYRIPRGAEFDEALAELEACQ